MSVRAMSLLLNPAACSHMRHAPMRLGRLCIQASCSRRAYGTGVVEVAPFHLRSLVRVLLDIEGTLLETSQPVPEVYARIGAKHGASLVNAHSLDCVLCHFRANEGFCL
jgi:hypothetical protein